MKFLIFGSATYRNSICLKIFVLFISVFTYSVGFLQAQNDTMYIWKAGSIINKQSVKTADIDSITSYRPISKPEYINIDFVDIPSGTFTMGSPTGEINHYSNEIEHQVTLSAFRISKYEIKNAQFAIFLNSKGIGSDGKYSNGSYPSESLIFANTYSGLIYVSNKWVSVSGFENHPVVNVTWYGAAEFAAFMGGALPTEAQWEYACRGGTTTPFNTGSCLTDSQANYDWRYPQTNCTNVNTSKPVNTISVGTYSANAFGLYDMHGNVSEWCNDWFGTYPNSPQVNPTGSTTSWGRIFRGGSLDTNAVACRSACRGSGSMGFNDHNMGFRIVQNP